MQKILGKKNNDSHVDSDVKERFSSRGSTPELDGLVAVFGIRHI